MKKINRLTILMGLLFAVSACGGNTDIEEEEEEEGENSGYVGNKDKNNDTPNPNPQPDQPQENPIFQTDSGKAFKKLLSIANNQLVGAKNLNANTEYVSGIASLEYTSSKVVFCALGNKQDNTDYLVKVTMNYAFATAEDFVSTMMNADAGTASTTYSVSCVVMNIYGEPQVNNRFHELKGSKIPGFDESKFNSQCCYRADNSETNYFAFTYVGTDSKVHSINEITLDMDTNEVTIGDGYSVASDSAKMFKLFDIILENY